MDMRQCNYPGSGCLRGRRSIERRPTRERRAELLWSLQAQPQGTSTALTPPVQPPAAGEHWPGRAAVDQQAGRPQRLQGQMGGPPLVLPNNFGPCATMPATGL